MTTATAQASNGAAPALPKVDPADFAAEVRELVREAITDDQAAAAPKEVAESVLRVLVKDKRHDLLIAAARAGLLELVWHEVRHDATRVSSYRVGSSRWERASEAAGEHPDIFCARVHTGTETKFLRDCTKADQQSAAAYKRKHAGGLIDNAERLEKLSRKLRKDQTVDALEREVVEEVFHV